jgi:hypothetical protein
MKQSKFKKIFIILITILTISYFVFLFYWQFFGNVEERIMESIVEHYIVFLGLPSAALTSLMIVLLLEQSSGKTIEFSGLGFSFKGASGQIVLWIFCYLVIISSIKLLW